MTEMLRINILQDAEILDAEILKKFFSVSRPLRTYFKVDAEMDMGTVPICRSASRSYTPGSGPLEVLPDLEHSGTSKK